MDESAYQLLSPSPVGYEEALRKAWKELDRQSDGGIVRRKAVKKLSNRCIEVPFLGRNYRVDISSRRVKDPTGKEVSPFLKVLLLHYIVGLSSAKADEDWLSFRQLRGGATYYPAFATRTIRRLREEFNRKEENFRKAAEAIGGEELTFKDISFAFYVFPRVRLAVILHCATDEFGTDANILYDKAAAAHLETEDLAVCGALLVSDLVKVAKQMEEQI